MREVDHRAEHHGCAAAYPWDRSCSLWSRTEALLDAARDDVRRMDRRDIDTGLADLRRWGQESYRRSEARRAYIAHVEGYEDDEHEIMHGLLRRAFAADGGHQSASARRAADTAWARTRGSLALAVLYAYRDCIPVGV